MYDVRFSYQQQSCGDFRKVLELIQVTAQYVLWEALEHTTVCGETLHVWGDIIHILALCGWVRTYLYYLVCLGTSGLEKESHHERVRVQSR